MSTNYYLDVIPISKVKIDERARKDFGTEEYKSAFKATVKKYGILQPILVQKEDNGEFKLLAGHSRLLFAMESGESEIPAKIFNEPLPHDEQLEIELIENMWRKNLTYDEEAKLIKRLHEARIERYGKRMSSQPDDEGWSLEKTAQLLGMSKSRVHSMLQLADFVHHFPEVKEVAKTQADAFKMIRDLKREMDVDEKATEVKEKIFKTNESKKKALIESFIVIDAVEGLKSLPDKCADLIEVDPPYPFVKGDLKDIMSRTLLAQYNAATLADFKTYSDEEYTKMMHDVFRECRRIIKPDGWLIIWQNPEQSDRKALESHGFEVMPIPAIWDKVTFGMTLAPHKHLANTYEWFLYACPKGGRSKLNKYRSPIYDYRRVKAHKKIHLTEKPIQLYEDILGTFVPEGSFVVSPFVGSGNIILAGANYNCQVVGFELSERLFKEFIVRVNEDMDKAGFYESDVYISSDDEQEGLL